MAVIPAYYLAWELTDMSGKALTGEAEVTSQSLGQAALQGSEAHPV